MRIGVCGASKVLRRLRCRRKEKKLFQLGRLLLENGRNCLQKLCLVDAFVYRFFRQAFLCLATFNCAPICGVFIGFMFIHAGVGHDS